MALRHHLAQTPVGHTPSRGIIVHQDDVLQQYSLRAAVDGCLDEASKFRPTDWQRVVTRRAGEQRTAIWLIRQAAHGGRHHLRDIARVGSPKLTRRS
jgi:hypothetical protein